ncbi:MAG: DoxX family protein [Bacteroidia bacterium]
MITTIWILKGLIAALFAFVGANKMLIPKTSLLKKGMKGLVNLDEKQIKIAGILEVLGAIGLFLPSVLNYYPILSAVSALCLGLTMIVAGLINYKLKLSIIPNIVIFAICIFIAYWEVK